LPDEFIHVLRAKAGFDGAIFNNGFPRNNASDVRVLTVIFFWRYYTIMRTVKLIVWLSATGKYQNSNKSKILWLALFESQRNTRRPKSGGTQLYKLMYKGIKSKCTPCAGESLERGAIGHFCLRRNPVP
jgi:hypothetical protein